LRQLFSFLFVPGAAPAWWFSCCKICSKNDR